MSYAQMGLRVFPLQPGTKIPATVNGVKDASRDEAQIRAWWTANTDYGVALAPEFKVGGACFLEFDQRPWLPAWAKEENQPKPQTRLHKSGGKDSPHYIFTHTEKSLELGNVNGTALGHEWFSFRADGRYVVAPPSIHPDSKREYTCELDVVPAPIPDWLVAKIAKEGVSERKFSEGLRETSEDFDDEAFFDWLEDTCGCDLGVEDGSWIPFMVCPVAGHRHSGQGVRGCALFWDGGGLGFKCHAQGCPSNTDRKPNQSGIGFLVSFLSKEFEAFGGTIWDEQTGEELAEEFGAVDVEKEKDEREAKLAAARFAEKAKDFKPGTVVPCAKCGGVVFKTMVPKGEEPRCPDHSFVAELLAEEASLAASEAETEIAAPAFSREAAAGAVGEFEVQAGTNSKGDVIQLMG
ncbi:MAG: bifunctional DNA primase/polymerase, partial [Candidatus Acidiferrum sp.]